MVETVDGILVAPVAPHVVEELLELRQRRPERSEEPQDFLAIVDVLLRIEG
jgi:hypothetical protein